MKIAAAVNPYPVLNQNRPHMHQAARQGVSQRALKVTPPPTTVRPVSIAQATYNQSGRTALTTRGHFVDQYI